MLTLLNEVDGALACPCRLVHFRTDSFCTLPHCIKVTSQLTHPLCVVMPLGPVIAWGMAELPIVKAIVNTRLGSIPGALKMELPDHSAVISGLGNQFGNDWMRGWKRFIPIPGVVQSRRIHARHEARTTRGADWALAIGVSEGHAFCNELINGRGSDMWIAQRTDSVKTLLIGAVPENIRAVHR